MRTEDGSAAETLLDKRRLQSLGVLIPIRLHTLFFLPGRHPLGRAGEGMRFLRTRPYEPGEDNPRNIDKFSPPGEYWINEWEAEAQAWVRVFGDVSGSMAFAPKASIRNHALLQLNYSLWRASDRVRTTLYSRQGMEEFMQRNLRTQLEKLTERLSHNTWEPGQDELDVLNTCVLRSGARDHLIFVVSDFSPVSEVPEETWREEWRSVLRRLSCDVVPVIVSFELPIGLQGSIKLWDPERQVQRLTLLSPSRVEEINERERLRVTELQSLFRGLGLDYLTLRSERDVYPQLARLAAMRRRRKL